MMIGLGVLGDDWLKGIKWGRKKVMGTTRVGTITECQSLFSFTDH